MQVQGKARERVERLCGGEIRRVAISRALIKICTWSMVSRRASMRDGAVAGEERLS